MIFAILKNNVPLVSSNPLFKPATENGWQGNPPQQMSKLGIFAGIASFISSLKYKYFPFSSFSNNLGSITL